MRRKYGCNPDIGDHRDYLYAVKPIPADVPVPDRYEIPTKPPIWDQGQEGSCTGFGIARAVAIQVPAFFSKVGLVIPRPSPQFIYYNERSMEGTIKQDAGAMIRDGMKVLQKFGACEEKYWPYEKKFTSKPNKRAFTSAAKNKFLRYSRIPALMEPISQALRENRGVIIGVSVYESFESSTASTTGIIPMPLKLESLLGGHCMCIVGYDHITRRYTVANSWGNNWGDKGYCYMPYDYIHSSDLCNDIWMIG